MVGTDVPSDHTAIQISGLTKKFGQLVAVDDLSLEIYEGEILGFLGPNGAGKTTTINMLCGLSPPTKGEILFSQVGVQNLKEMKIHMGICPQENIYWPRLTCQEQLAFMGEMYGLSKRTARDRAKSLLQLMGLENKANVLANQLSGGMKRRLNICLALIHDPEILILDEPEAGLDPQSKIMVRDFIKSLAKQKTVILTTHNMDEADRVADRVAIIDHGKLLLVDTPTNLKKSIGTGDLLEVIIEGEDEGNLELVVTSLSEICDNVNIKGMTLFLQSKNLIENVADITERIKQSGFRIRTMTLRENTLEDVFIHLTGKRLRQ